MKGIIKQIIGPVVDGIEQVLAGSGVVGCEDRGGSVGYGEGEIGRVGAAGVAV